MKGKFLKAKNTGKARFVYTVHGTTKEIAEYVENQGEYCRFMQEDGTISDEETNTPVYYSTQLRGKNPELTWDDENQRYNASIPFEDIVVMEAISRKYSVDTTNTNVESNSETNSEDADDAELEQVKKKTGILKKRR